MSDGKTASSGASSSLTGFLKSIANFNGDLASLTAPPFILSPVSLTEYSQFWIGSRELFLAASQEKDKEKRMLLVVKWFLGTLRGQYASRNEKLGSEKKPLNPFLGEVFTGKWVESGADKAGDIVLVSEQVSHHPPVTGYSIWNDTNKVSLQGYNQIKATLSATTISVRQYGHGLYKLGGFDDETYLVTLPNLHIEGIVFGSPYVELEGKSYIQSSSGYKATLEYSGKGYFSGKKNSFKAKVVHSSQPDTKLYSITGQWSGDSKIKNEKSSVESPFLDAAKIETEPLVVKPLEEQGELESRKAWKKVADAVNGGDYDKIHVEKSKIENEQRDLRKQETAEGKVWNRMWFEEVTVASEPYYVRLAKDANVVAGTAHASSSSDTKGTDPEKDTNWRFVRAKYDSGNVKAQ